MKLNINKIPVKLGESIGSICSTKVESARCEVFSFLVGGVEEEIERCHVIRLLTIGTYSNKILFQITHFTFLWISSFHMKQ